MRKKWLTGSLAVLLAFVLVLTGCGAKETPKNALEGAFIKSTEMKSYAFKSSITVNDLQMDGADLGDPSVAMVINMLKNAELTIDGVAQLDPMQVEATLNVALKGDMAFSFSLPMVITPDKMYYKIPNIPMLGIPADIVDKYLVLDMKELAEQAGEPIPTVDVVKTQKFSNEFLKEVLGKFDEKTYFSEIAVKDANLPEGVEAKQVVKVAITKDNFDQAVTTIVKDALPALIDLMSKDEYKELFQIDQADLDQLKSEMTATDSELKEGLEEIKKSLTVNELSMTTAINKDGFPVYQTIIGNVDFKDETDQMKLVVHVNTTTSNINEKAEFKIGIPTDTITMEQLQESYFGAMYDLSEYDEELDAIE